MYPLYPAIKTYAKHHLAVDSTHKIYIEECGSADGYPVIVIHDGPGAGSNRSQRRFFDPQYYRIILYDQRGAGYSSPHTELQHNTTQDLIADLEAIRNYLSIKRWTLFGGAWGATLSLLYAEQYPQHVSGLVLHSILLGRVQDIQWLYQQGTNLIFPDHWQEFMANLAPKECTDVIGTYHKRLNGTDDIVRMSAAKSWSLWKARCAALQSNHEIIDNCSDPRFALNLAKIETHYLKHHYFLEDNQIMANCHQLKNIPGYIIHGRYDMVCPLQAAWELHQAWPGSELYVIRDAGHSIKELGIIDALILATKKIAQYDPGNGNRA